MAKLTVQRIELNRFSVTLDVLVSLAQALRVSLPELLTFSQ